MRLAFFIALIFSIKLAEAAPVKVTESLAQVGSMVITSREIRAMLYVDQVLESEKPSPALLKKFEAPAAGTELYKKKLSQVVLDGVLSLEAENFSVAEVSLEEIRNKKNLIMTSLKDNAGWKALEIQEPELQNLLARKLKAKVFLKYKSDTSAVNVTDEEAKAYYEKNRVKFGNLPFTQFRESIRSYLSETQVQEKLRDWFEILKRKYKVKYLQASAQ